jgi:signal transduction histidine kinase
VPPYLWIQRGLLAKAHRATRSLQLFINLSNGQPLILRMAKIGSEDLRKRLIETCLDNRILASSRRVVEFDVKADTFEMLDALDLIADMDLIEQAVNNVIDNAFKYSYLRKKIEISGSDAGKYFRLTVSNEGIPLLASDLGKLGTRGFRGDLAESVVGEGSGIGLWVVRNILEAHGGRLIPEATSNGRTSIHLELPWA